MKYSLYTTVKWYNLNQNRRRNISNASNPEYTVHGIDYCTTVKKYDE